MSIVWLFHLGWIGSGEGNAGLAVKFATIVFAPLFICDATFQRACLTPKYFFYLACAKD